MTGNLIENMLFAPCKHTCARRQAHAHVHIILLKFLNASGHIVSTFQASCRINASLKESLGCHGNIYQNRWTGSMLVFCVVSTLSMQTASPTVGNVSFFHDYACLTASLTLCAHMNRTVQCWHKKTGEKEKKKWADSPYNRRESPSSNQPVWGGPDWRALCQHRHWITGKRSLFHVACSAKSAHLFPIEHQRRVAAPIITQISSSSSSSSSPSSSSSSFLFGPLLSGCIDRSC